jgi:hypothetical protein
MSRVQVLQAAMLIGLVVGALALLWAGAAAVYAPLGPLVVGALLWIELREKMRGRGGDGS